MTREEAAELALQSIILERQAVNHCTSLNNPEYLRLMRLSTSTRIIVEGWVEENVV